MSEADEDRSDTQAAGWTPWPAEPGDHAPAETPGGEPTVTPGWAGPPPTEAPGGRWVWQPWDGFPTATAAPTAPARSSRGRALAAVAAVFVAAAGAGVGARVALSSSPASSTATTLPGSGLTLPFGGGTGLTPGSSGGGGSATGNGSSTGTGGGDAASIAAGVTPGVVDVNVTEEGGGSAAGTGMVITRSGEVLTNNHVIDGATSITVTIAGTGPTHTAHVLGYDVSADVALLQVDGVSNLATVSLGSSSTLAVGDAVVAIGNALGRSGPPSVTSGSVTALGQQITATDAGGTNAETLTGLIQIDAPIQPGDSGGPLVSTSGKVVGMDTAAQSSGRFRFGGQASMVAFAIPIDTAMTVVHQIESGTASDSVVIGQTRALLGVETQDGQGGVQVVGVQPNSPAAQAGMTAGDVITALGGAQVASTTDLRNAMLQHRPNDRVTVTWTDASGGGHQATVTLTQGPPA